MIEGGRTYTQVAPLDAEARVEELARMLGGGENVEPERIEINTGLSDAVAAAVPRVVDIIQAEVRSDGG